MNTLTIPADMGIGMDGFVLDPEWIWMKHDGDTVTGFLAASPCHGMVFVLRLVIREGAPEYTLALLLREFVRDCKARGYAGIFTYLDPKRNAELAFMKVIKRAGGVIFSKPQFSVAATISQLERW